MEIFSWRGLTTDMGSTENISTVSRPKLKTVLMQEMQYLCVKFQHRHQFHVIFRNLPFPNRSDSICLVHLYVLKDHCLIVSSLDPDPEAILGLLLDFMPNPLVPPEPLRSGLDKGMLLVAEMYKRDFTHE